MNSHGDRKPEPPDPEQLLRLLDLEMAQKRAARQRAGTPYRGFRAASLVFLVVIILGGLVGFYYLFFSGGLEELRAHNEPRASATPSSATP